MKNIFICCSLILSISANAQKKIDSSFPFQSNPSKKYSLYIPSSYDDSKPNAMMLAFHPFNLAKWSGFTWRDSLVDFAEENGLILVSPDGGTNGAIDDQIDYDFTTALLDSVMNWYNINEKKIYAMGFSVGGKAMYEYGLQNAKVFSGFIPIGPAINGIQEVEGLLPKAACKPFYLIHGENDAPATRYEPIKAALIQNKAEVNFILMAGVNHTFSFPNRNSILKSAFRWIDTVTCKSSTGINTVMVKEYIKIRPSVVSGGLTTVNVDLILKGGFHDVVIRIWDVRGQLVLEESTLNSGGVYELDVSNFKNGSYLLQVQKGKMSYAERFIVL